MNTKQKIAIFSPIVLIGTMTPLFQILAKLLGGTLGWYLGLIIYWIIWGGVYSWMMIGAEGIKKITKPQMLNFRNFLYVFVLLILSFIFKTITVTEYQKPETWILILYLSTNVGNGIFEEILWRGVYMELFPRNNLIRILWSSIWFGLWHYAPGTVSSSGNAIGLMIGSGFMGLYLSVLAKKTDTAWWGIVAHILGGLIMVS